MTARRGFGPGILAVSESLNLGFFIFDAVDYVNAFSIMLLIAILPIEPVILTGIV